MFYLLFVTMSPIYLGFWHSTIVCFWMRRCLMPLFMQLALLIGLGLYPMAYPMIFIGWHFLKIYQRQTIKMSAFLCKIYLHMIVNLKIEATSEITFQLLQRQICLIIHFGWLEWKQVWQILEIGLVFVAKHRTLRSWNGIEGIVRFSPNLR